jgi:hypothetical protein
MCFSSSHLTGRSGPLTAIFLPITGRTLYAGRDVGVQHLIKILRVRETRITSLIDSLLQQEISPFAIKVLK